MHGTSLPRPCGAIYQRAWKERPLRAPRRKEVLSPPRLSGLLRVDRVENFSSFSSVDEDLRSFKVCGTGDALVAERSNGDALRWLGGC